MNWHWFVGRVYSDHNRSPLIQRPVQDLLLSLNNGGWGVDIGGDCKRHPRLLTVNLQRNQNTDVVADAMRLPFGNESIDVVITQETLEHVRCPDIALAEIYRVLKPGGTLFCQLPFVIGYHPGPYDFYRFSREGIVALVERAGFKPTRVSVSVGPAAAFSRICAEFLAASVATLSPRLYRPAKGAGALLFYPLKWMEPVLLRSPQIDRLAGGYIVIAQRGEGPAQDTGANA